MVILIFMIFSDIPRMRSIPAKISRKPANEWTRSAVSSPNKYPVEITVVMRTMFRTVKTANPEMKSRIFFAMEVDDMKVRKAANIVNAIREYMPEQGMSTENDTCCPAVVVSMSVGGP